MQSLSKLTGKLHWFVPPIVPLAFRKLATRRQAAAAAAVRRDTDPPAPSGPRWCEISTGPLTGRRLFIDPDVQAYQPAMLNGTYDQPLFTWLDKHDWSGKVIYDIGTHIGFHALVFADRVGPAGRVYSFEPHPLHRERIEQNLSGNAELASRVTLLPVAVSDGAGTLTFHCASTVETGESSGSFIEGASTTYPRSAYGENYRPVDVASVRIDDVVAERRCAPPDLLKIDVEGAEGLVVVGALTTIRTYKPLLLIEVHSSVNMLQLATALLPLGYNFICLQEEDRRCFVAVIPNGSVPEDS